MPRVNKQIIKNKRKMFVQFAIDNNLCQFKGPFLFLILFDIFTNWLHVLCLINFKICMLKRLNKLKLFLCKYQEYLIPLWYNIQTLTK